MSLDLSNLIEPDHSIIDVVLPERQSGESAFDTAIRLLVTEALIFTDGNQKEAAEMLGISPRVVNYWVGRHKLLPRRSRESA